MLRTISLMHDLTKILSQQMWKLLLLLCLIFAFQEIALGQDKLLEKQIFLQEQSISIEEALKQLSKAGEFTFSYSNDLPLKKIIHLNEGIKPVSNHLDNIFKGVLVEYIEKEGKILIVLGKKEIPNGDLKQIIVGKIVDKDSKIPLPGVHLVLSSDKPIHGTISDSEGSFRIENVPLGRHDLSASYVGYEGRTIHNLFVGSGKVPIVRMELEESITDLREVVIMHEINKRQPMNDMATISARKLSSEEVNYYPGAMTDISRAAVSFPGVMSSNDGQNHIIIRGNSPKGLMWQLEGVEIPNLNHFAEIGSSGGGVSILSNNMIGNADFFTGAFPAEYGNAISGVFDLSLRTGNIEKHEQTFQIGLMGTELMVEGPLGKESNASYIGQYRYNTLKLATLFGVELDNIPSFQDLSFKFNMPTSKLGTFSLFGIGGYSNELGESGYDFTSSMGVIGLGNSLVINEKTFLKSVISFSGWQYIWDEEDNIGTVENPIDYLYRSDVVELSSKISVSLTRKISPKHKLKSGIIFSNTGYTSYLGWHSDTLYNRFIDPNHPLHSDDIRYSHSYSDADGSASTFQAYLSWKYRVTPNLTLISGVHYLQFFLNNNYSVEPRIGIHWQFLPKHSISAGYGVHSRKESLSLYTGTKTLHDGEEIHPNRDLEITKSQHYIVGYDFLITDDLHASLEAYYQYLYDIPTYPFPPYFSTINFDYGFEGNILVSRGTATNKGIELALEKYMSNGFSFMVNGTLYESKFKNYQGEEYNTKFNGSYAAAGLVMKEFKIGSRKQNILGISSRIIYTGGFRYLPTDLEQSILTNSHVKIWDHGFTEKATDFFRVDLQVNLRRNKSKYTSEWRLDIINLTNHSNMLEKDLDTGTGRMVTLYQNPLIPLLSYRIQF